MLLWKPSERWSTLGTESYPAHLAMLSLLYCGLQKAEYYNNKILYIGNHNIFSQRIYNTW